MFHASVSGLITFGGGGDAGGAFLRGGIDRLKKDLKPEFFILFNHLGSPMVNCFFYLSKART
jgi:hypothetical protein